MVSYVDPATPSYKQMHIGMYGRITLIMYRKGTCTDFVQYYFLFETDLDLISDIK